MVTDDDIGTHENPGLGQDHLGEVLVHAVGTCRDTAPDIAHAGHLQQALDGPVLAERTMEYREDHLNEIGVALGVNDAGTLRHLLDRHQGTIPHLHDGKLAGAGQAKDLVNPVSHPDTIGGDAHTGDIESFTVNRSYHVRR